MPVPHKVTNDFFVPPIDQLITERENVYEIIDYEFIYERFNCPFLLISHEHDEDNDYDDPSYYYPNTNTHDIRSIIIQMRINALASFSNYVSHNIEDLHIIPAFIPPNAPSDPDHKDRRKKTKTKTKAKAEYQTPKQEINSFIL